MGKRIIISKEEKKHIKGLYEQRITDLPQNEHPKPTFLTKEFKDRSCVPFYFQSPIENLTSKGYNKLFLKTALGIIGRESDFGKSDRYKALSLIKSFIAKFGIDTSVGLAQIKPETAAQYGLSVEDLQTATGALIGAYNIIKENYNTSLSNGYDNSPSINLTEGTGNSALDIAILGYNMGVTYITKYCETSDPKIKGKCANKETKSGLKIYQNKIVKNYIPNYKTERWDGVSISSHGYVIEVAKRIKEYNCSIIN